MTNRKPCFCDQARPPDAYGKGMFTLHDYQREAVRFALHAFRSTGGCGLFLDMGLGKTLTSIAIMDICHAADPTLKFLVVAPLRPAKDTWAAELEKFKGLHSLDWAVCTGTPKQRRKALDQEATVTVINQENLVWLDSEMRRWPWRAVVVDELSGFRNPRAKRFRVLRRRRKGFDWVLGLTGTPAPKGLMDLWAQVFLLDGGAALGRTVTEYRRHWFTPGAHRGDVVFEWRPRPDAYREIMDAIGGFCLTMLAKDRLTGLPRSTVIDHMLDMPRATRTVYDRLRRDLCVGLGGREVAAANAGVLAGKLSQVTAGCLYPGPDTPDAPVTHLDDVKLDELDAIIDGSGGEQILVFYQLVDELERLRARHPETRMVGQDGVVAAWNRGEVPLLAAHPASARFGLNLQAGGHIVVWLSVPWSIEDWLQGNARLDRQGQTRPVQIHRLVERDTIDTRKCRVLEGRLGLQDAIMGELGDAYDKA